MTTFTERLVPVHVEAAVIIPPRTPGGETRTVMVTVPAMKDPKDGEIYYGTDASAMLDKAKAHHMGVMAPQELAALRERLGLTWEGIAEALQVSEQTWSRWEVGREIVPLSMSSLLSALSEGRVGLHDLRKTPTPGPTGF